MTVTAEQLDDRIFESLHGVDTSEDGSFKNVKICGLESKNGRIYPEQTLRQAVPLYEGMPVYIDHPGQGQNPSARGYRDRFGRISNPRFVAGSGVFGTVEYNPEHALAKSVKWDIEHKTKGVGLSHVVQASAVRQGGKAVVESIKAVASVDIVDGPATNSSFFEQTSGDQDVKIEEITLEQLKKDRPDLITSLAKEQEGSQKHADLQKQLQETQSELAKLKLQTAIEGEIKDAGLTAEQVSEVFRKQLLATESADDRKALLKDRADIVKANGGGTAQEQGKGQASQLTPPASKAPSGTQQAAESAFAGKTFKERQKLLAEQSRKFTLR